MSVLFLTSFSLPPIPFYMSADNKINGNLNSLFLIPAYSEPQYQGNDNTENGQTYSQMDSNREIIGREYSGGFGCTTFADGTVDCNKQSKTEYDNDGTSISSSPNVNIERRSDPQIAVENTEDRPDAATAGNEQSNLDNKVIDGELKEEDSSRRTDPKLQPPSDNSNSGDKQSKCMGEEMKIKNVIRGSGCIKGTDNKDFIQAIPNPKSPDGDVDNIIFGKDKPDVIFSDVGIDLVYGGSGGDTVQGGPGSDQIFGGGGDDHLFGGSDDDLIVGGRGNNHMYGDIGNDVLKGGKKSGANYFDCGEGLDTIIDFNLAKGDVTAGNCEIF
jgi:Ca2+-binding RTX toxin-like protein